MGINVSLTPETEAYAKSLVASGFYKSISEVVRESLRLHRKLENLYLQELHQDLGLAADQIDTKQTESHDMQDIIDIIDRVDAKRKRRK